MARSTIHAVWKAALAALLLLIIGLLLTPQASSPAKPPRAASIAAVARKRPAVKQVVEGREPVESQAEVRACAQRAARSAPPTPTDLRRGRDCAGTVVHLAPPPAVPTRSPPSPRPAVALRL